jgi:drug/metabolite transporter (DMT)-like permease
VIAAARLTLASLILAPYTLIRQRAELRRLTRRHWLLALLSGFFLAIHFATWISSLEYTTVASSAVLVATIPLWVALLSPFLLKESITRMVAAGLALTLLGGVIVGLSDSCSLSTTGIACPPMLEFFQGDAFLGDLLALAGALAGALYLIIGRRLRTGMPLAAYIFVVYSMAAVCLLIWMAVAGESLFGYSPKTYMWFLLLALIPQLLGHSTFNWALRYLSAAYVSVTLLGEPIGSTILAVILLSETPAVLKIIGAILIMAGIYIASINEKKKPHPADPRSSTAQS